MFLVPRRQIRTSQPQGPVAVDPAYKDGLIACFHAPTLSDVSGKQNSLTYTLSANLERVVGGAGKGLLYQNNTPTLYYANASGLISNAKSLIISAVVQKQLVDKQMIVFAAWASVYQVLCQITADGSIAWGIYQDSGNVSVKSTAPGVVPTGRPIRLVVGFENGELSCFIDGAPVPFITNGWVVGSPTQVNNYGANNLAFGGYADGNWHAGTVYHLAAWTRGGLPKQDISANPWQIFKRPDSRIFVPVSAGGGTTTVTSDSTASYKLQGSVQASASAAYDIRTAIQADSAASYTIRSSVQQSATPSYAIRAAIQQDTAANYLIQGAVDQVIAASFAIRSAISGDASATYNILSATEVSSSTSAGYNIRGSINQDNVANYLIRGSINQDSAASYALRGSITQDTAASYALRGSITQDTSATYSILSASSVSSSVTAGYVVKGSVESSIVAGYSIAQAVQAEIAASYIIRSGVVSEAQAAYIVRGLAQQSVAASYSVFSEYAAPSTFADRTDLKSMMTQHAELKSMMTQHLLLQASIG